MINNSASHSATHLNWSEQKSKLSVIQNEVTERIAKLKELKPIPTGLEVLKKLSAQRGLKPYLKNEIIYKESKYPIGIYFVVQGRLKTYKIHEQGKTFITGVYTEGDLFGYSALLEEGQYTDSAMTMEDSVICLITKEDFCSLVYKNAEVSRTFIKMLSDNLREKEEQLIKLAYNSVRKRVAEALVELSDHCKKDSEHQFNINISRKDLASIVGTATETTIRVLCDFKNEGLVEINEKGGSIEVTKYDSLAHMRN